MYHKLYKGIMLYITMVKVKKMINLDEEFKKEVEKYCEEGGRVFSRIVELAIEEYINNHPN